MLKYQITAAIVLYKNDRNILLDAINSLLATDLKIKLYLVDNSPTKELSDLWSVDDYRVEYISNPSNLGFGAAHNIAIKKSIEQGTKYHLVLNPDIHFEKDVIENLVSYMDENPDVGLVMPKVLNPDSTVQYLPKLLPSPAQLLKRKITISKRLYEKWNCWYEMHHLPHDLIYEAAILSGCFSFFRVDALKKVGGYDERFFMYFEDFDLSRRIHKYYRTMYYPLQTIYHEYGRGAHKSIKLFGIFTLSAIRYFNKWGWFFDEQRECINNNIIKKISE